MHRSSRGHLSDESRQRAGKAPTRIRIIVEEQIRLDALYFHEHETATGNDAVDAGVNPPRRDLPGNGLPGRDDILRWPRSLGRASMLPLDAKVARGGALDGRVAEPAIDE